MPNNESRFIDPFEANFSVTGHECVRGDGVVLPAPHELQPGQVRGCLWELIYALAARRIFLGSTNHLSDAELYAWLYDQWLPNQIREVPADPDDNRLINLLGTGSEEDNLVWLRHYADEELRQRWMLDFPADFVPPHEAPPFDRDRWLPAPGVISDESNDEDEVDRAPGDESIVDDLHDPLQLELVDREIHLEQPIFDFPDGDNDEFSASESESSEESTAEAAIGIEQENWKRPHDELARAGVNLPPPEEMTDELLPAKLWEVLHELACLGFYVLHTNHLTDRELYTKLWRENLRQSAILPGPSTSGGWYHDFVGGDNDTDTQTWLKFYATDRQRESHAREYPDAPLPPRSECPSRRDDRVPHGPF